MIEIAPASYDTVTDVPVTTVSAQFVGGSMPNGGFLPPDTLAQTWSDGNAYCQGQGARLPTRDELKQLFLDATSVTSIGQKNIEMYTQHGWPLENICAGSSNWYWAGETSITSHYIVGMTSGGISDGPTNETSRQAACVP